MRPPVGQSGTLPSVSGASAVLRWLAVPLALMVAFAVAVGSRAETLEAYKDRSSQPAGPTRSDRAERFIRRVAILLVDTPDGSIEIDANEAPSLALDETGTITDFELPADGSLVGFRIDAGRLLPVLSDEPLGTSPVLVPEIGGFTLLRTDGERSKVERIGSGYRARLPGGIVLGLQVASPLVIGDQVEVREAGKELEQGDVATVALDPIGVGDQSDDGNLFGFLSAVGPLLLWGLGLAMAAAVVISVVRAVRNGGLRRRVVADEPIAEPAPAPEDLPVDLAGFLAGLRAHPDPSEAVRLAYRHAERGVGRLARRRTDATPGEWVRIVRRSDPHLAELLAPLARAYVRVRFGDLPATPAQRDAAVDALEELVGAAEATPIGAGPGAETP